MKKLMLVLFFMTAAAGAQTIIPRPTPAGGCELCAKVDKLASEADENEVSAARAYAELLDKAEFSKDAVLRKKEFQKVIPLAARLVEKDERFDIAQFLVSIRDTDRALYDSIVKQQPEPQRKTLLHWEQKMRKQFENGEEPDDHPEAKAKKTTR